MQIRYSTVGIIGNLVQEIGSKSIKEDKISGITDLLSKLWFSLILIILYDSNCSQITQKISDVGNL